MSAHSLHMNLKQSRSMSKGGVRDRSLEHGESVVHSHVDLLRRNWFAEAVAGLLLSNFYTIVIPQQRENREQSFLGCLIRAARYSVL